MKFLRENNLLFCLIACVTFLAFAKLGQKPPHEWDESRTAINAIEMTNNGDWINLHFAGQPDQIRAKPPLLIWLVAASFHNFGYNVFSLRIPSAIATIFIFFFLFKIVHLYKPPWFAFTVGLMLLTVRGIIGYHVGRTGDFDALLLCFLLGGLYYFLQYVDFDQKRLIYPAGIFWGLAFMTKGPAMAVLFPGLLLYIIQTNRFKLIFKKEMLLGMGLCAIFPIGWFITVHLFGHHGSHEVYSGNNAFQRMFLYDVVDRFTQTEFEGKTEVSDPFYLFRYLEISFKYWHYIFYLVVLLGVSRMLFTIGYPKFRPDQLLLFLSINIWFSLGLVLSLGTATKPWYMAPAIPFVAITTLYGIEWLYNYKYRRYKYIPHLFIAFVVFTGYMRYIYDDPNLPKVPETPALVSDNKEYLNQASELIYFGELPPQHILLGIYFVNTAIEFTKNQERLSDVSDGGLVFLPAALLEQPINQLSAFSIVGRDENYAILQKCRTNDVTYQENKGSAIYLPSNFHSTMEAAD